MASLIVCTSNFSAENRGVAVSLCASAVGLSALLVALSYSYFFNVSTGRGLEDFFLLWTVLQFTTYVVAALVAQVPGGVRCSQGLAASLANMRKALSMEAFWPVHTLCENNLLCCSHRRVAEC